MNSVKLLHIKCCFSNFSIVRWHWKINFAPPKKKLKWRPRGREERGNIPVIPSSLSLWISVRWVLPAVRCADWRHSSLCRWSVRHRRHWSTGSWQSRRCSAECDCRDLWRSIWDWVKAVSWLPVRVVGPSAVRPFASNLDLDATFSKSMPAIRISIASPEVDKFQVSIWQIIPIAIMKHSSHIIVHK